MFSDIRLLIAEERVRGLRETADRGREVGRSETSLVTLRYASEADASRLRHLAELDSAGAPAGRALVAEVDGRLRAALPLDGGAPIADPFHRSAELVELLRMRAAQLRRAGGDFGRASGGNVRGRTGANIRGRARRVLRG